MMRLSQKQIRIGVTGHRILPKYSSFSESGKLFNISNSCLTEKIASEMLQEKIIESKKDYLPHIPEKEQQLRKRLETVLNHFLPEYAKADLLADKYQNYYKNASKAIYILAAFAVIIISGQFIFDLNH